MFAANRLILLLAVLATAVAGSAGRAAAEPRRIVSLNVCTDQLLLALADPEQIAGLSIFAADPAFSHLAERAQRFRHDAGDAETVIRLKPDLVVSDEFTRGDTKALLRRLGYSVVEVPLPTTMRASAEQIRSFAALIGRPERGAVLAAAIETARLAAAGAAAPGVRPRVAAYERRGYMAGGGTLLDDLIAGIGWENAGGELAGRLGGFVPLERLVAHPPDFLLVSESRARPDDQGGALLAHPALQRLFPPQKRIVLPERLTVCAGPSLPEALRVLGEEARRVSGRRT